MALNVKELDAGYGKVQVLFKISLEVQKGTITTLIGPNGAGKTTTLFSIMGIVKPWGGGVYLNGVDVTRTPPHKKVELGIVLVPEGRRLFPNMTVEENLLMGAYVKRAHRHIDDSLEYVYSLFPRLKERRRQKAGTLSGGEQQMLAIGRALMSRPEVLLVDEPSAGLAPKVVAEMLEAFKRIKETSTILLVEQNVSAALAVADYGYVLENGRVVLSGPSGDLMENSHVKKAYLGV